MVKFRIIGVQDVAVVRLLSAKGILAGDDNGAAYSSDLSAKALNSLLRHCEWDGDRTMASPPPFEIFCQQAPGQDWTKLCQETDEVIRLAALKALNYQPKKPKVIGGMPAKSPGMPMLLAQPA
jgi:hypothetical protein